MKKILVILIILVMSILTVSCTKNTMSIDSQDNISKVYLAKYNAYSNSYINNEINQEEQFEIQLKEFYEFSNKFFPILNNHIEATAQLLDEFNNESIKLQDKITCSRILREKYEKFGDSLKEITPASDASKAYDYILNAISKRIIFFEEFEKGSNLNILTEIENEAYYYDGLFWEEIDRIYDYYLEEISQRNTISI